MSKGGWIKLLLLIGGTAIAGYVVYKMYEQKKASDSMLQTGPATTDVSVNDPYPQKPAAKRVDVPGRFV